jgi:serine/threonine protein kinase/Tfp pilus assembly protein PilF
MPLTAGDRLGPYEVLAPIGAGGMGEVWKARDTRLDRIVAIKQLKGQHSARFQQEARAVAALNHPNICTLYDVGPDYLVMEYIEGAPLRGPLPLEQALRFAAQIAGALGVAHSKGILHRDLKPENVLVTASGVKLLDFGLAKLMTDSDPGVTKTTEGAVLGTAAYMSPEQAQGKALDERSDVFSFGAVVYEMLSGARAFGGASMLDTLNSVVRDDPAPLQSPASDIVKRCLAKQPAQRFQSIAEVRAALESISTKPVEQQPSIAVLPFANMSADKENEYFSDGLAEEILNLLAKIPGLKVIARTSSFAFRGQEQDIRKIAERLNVRTILEGSVRRAGNRVRVTAQLINAADESHLWSERYDRDLTDIFAIQDEIGQAISESLKVRLAPRARTVNVEAYQLYLKGQYHILRFTPENLTKAKECFEQALAIDPNYALAHGGLATYYYTLVAMGIKPASDMAASAKAAAEKALAIDPTDSEVHSVLAMIAVIFGYDWKVAEAHFRKAMANEPIPPRVRFRYALWYLLPLGRFPEAREQGRLALESDPLSMLLNLCMTSSMYYAKQYREAIECARRALEIDTTFYLTWLTMGLAQLQAGLAQEAITSLKRGVDLSPWDSMGSWYLAAAYRQAGDREHSQELVRKLADSHRRPVGAAIYYAATGEVDAMFEGLDAAYQQRDPGLAGFQNEPFFDPYRADPRFRALLQRMNLA